MIKLSGSVGRMGLNKKHDVALVQRIMGAIKVRTKFGLKPIWTKKPDGRYTPAMEPAIMCLQVHMGMKPTGKLEPTIQTMNALSKVAPRELRNLSAVAGTTSLFTTGQSNPRADRAARDLEAKAPFPNKERKALAEALRRVGKETGFCLRRKHDFVTNDGRFASELAFDITTIPEAGTGRDVERALCKIVGAAPEWSAISPNRLAFKTKLQLKALKGLGTGPLSGDDKKLLGLTTPPKGAALTACAKGCASLIRSGQISTTAGSAEFEILLQAISAPNQSLAKQITQAAAVQLIWVNPTGHGIRQVDAWGSGAFGASRDGGARQHLGVDYIATLNQSILAAVDGTIYRLGFPYANDLSYRYVGIQTSKGHQVREMYVDPAPNIQLGAKVSAGDVIGTYQSLQKRFPGITEHIHLDIRLGGTFIDPTSLIP